ncbi:MAG: hypothetical protein M1118_07380 [Chloroflexi bacterium]|nr:hypothetical protein [Chloroflexota bacterium]
MYLRAALAGTAALSAVLLTACGATHAVLPLAQNSAGGSPLTPPPATALTPVQAVLVKLLLTPSQAGSGFASNGSAGSELHGGPGMASVAERLVATASSGQRTLYIRVSRFTAPGPARAEFEQESGDISRSSTVLQNMGVQLGDRWMAYSVQSGAHNGATASVGVLIQNGNYLCSIVLTGAPGSVNLSDLLPLAQKQVQQLP